jgi:hypothetical protein
VCVLLMMRDVLCCVVLIILWLLRKRAMRCAVKARATSDAHCDVGQRRIAMNLNHEIKQ